NNDDWINLNKESSEDIFVKIEKLSKLKDMGAINEDEFNEKKKELLARI
ncbi:MAG: SHOCT domain-containing protein, partial [Clostridiales bacterium]|nr:SHOCT domain-containing protein [Clostridiales bacterium]